MKEQGIGIPQMMPAMGGPKGISGPIMHDGGGRSDDVSANLSEGSYVIPAMAVSALGQGNTDAGMRILSEMFGGGEQQDGRDGVDAMVSGGEFVIPAVKVAELGNGDPEAGADILDQFIMSIRGEQVQNLQTTPGPA